MEIGVKKGRKATPGAQDRHLRRARRRSRVHPLLPRRSGSTTSPARRTACRSPAWPRPRPSSRSPSGTDATDADLLPVRDGQDRAAGEFDAARLKEDPEALHWIDLEDPTPEEARDPRGPVPLPSPGDRGLPRPKCTTPRSTTTTSTCSSSSTASASTRRPTSSSPASWTSSWARTTWSRTTRGPCARSRPPASSAARTSRRRCPRGVDFLLHQILDQMFEHYFPNLDADRGQDPARPGRGVREPDPRTPWTGSSTSSATSSSCRRICAPQREIVHRLSRGEFKVIGPKAAVYFRDIYDNLYRDRGRVLPVPGHDPGDARRLPVAR